MVELGDGLRILIQGIVVSFQYFIVVAFSVRLCIPVLKPFIGERTPVNAAATPDTRTPPTQPQTAQNVFFEYPFKKISPAAADTADTAFL